MQNEQVELVNHIVESFHAFSRRSFALSCENGWTEIDLTMPQLKALIVVSTSDGMSMTQLARSLGMTLSTATGVADRLIAHGLVQRGHDPRDRRLVLLRTTEAGNAYIDRLTRISEQMVEMVANRLSVEDLSMVARALDMLYDALLSAAAEQSQMGKIDGSPEPAR